MLRFGMSMLHDPPPTAPVDLAVFAEGLGFDTAWVTDSQVLFQDPFPAMTMILERTQGMKVGTCVTNPVTRHWSVTASFFATLQELSGGRAVLGIGRGDSALRIMGKKPSTLKYMEDAIDKIKAFAGGEEIVEDGTIFKPPWVKEQHQFPIYVAAYGPKALRLAGRVADGVIIQIADPFVVDWCLEFVKVGAEESGRNFRDINVQVAGATFISNDLEYAREQVRWYPALVSNHVMDMLEYHKPEGLPKELIEYTKLRNKDTYHYEEHSRRGSKHSEFVPDEIVDRFTVIGPASACADKLAEFEAIGVTEWNIYANWVPNPEKLLKTYGESVIPKFQ